MKVTGIIPNLITNDIGRALAFYRDVLGFTVLRTVPEAAPFVFAMLDRDGVQVFLNDARTVREELPDATSLVVGRSGVALFVTVEGIEKVWADLRERTTVVMPLKQQWYGMTEFTIADPDGYVLTFAERTASAG